LGRSAPKFYEFGWGGTAPTTFGGSGAQVTLLSVYRFGHDGWIVGARYYRNQADDFRHFAWVSDPTNGDIHATLAFKRKPASGSGVDGWQHAYFPRRVAVRQFDIWGLAVWFEGSDFYYDPGALSSNGFLSGHVETLQDGLPYPNMQFSYSSVFTGFASSSGSRYGIDVIFWPGDQ
jgi:hypothetical protein